MKKESKGGQARLPNPELRERSSAAVSHYHTLEGHGAEINTVIFDSKSRLLASGGKDRTVNLWDAGSGRLLRTLRSHGQPIYCVAFDPQGALLASASGDWTAKLWEVSTGKLLRTLEGHQSFIFSVAFHPEGATLATGSGDRTVKVWNAHNGDLIRTLKEHGDYVRSVAFDPQTGILASGGDDKTVKIWKVESGELVRSLEAHEDFVYSIAFAPDGGILATGSRDRTVKLWEVGRGKLVRTLEGHSGGVEIVSFSPDGRLLASRSEDDSIRLWSCETWRTIAVISEPTDSAAAFASVAFHPTEPLLAAAGSGQDSRAGERSRLIHLWKLDLSRLLGKRAEMAAARSSVHHTTAKIVLVGDHSVGKSALGHRLIYDRFEKQESSHGQRFWVFPALGKRRGDGTDCEAVLWDFAGQPDYRLVHALFLDDADLALVLFDASDLRDPLHGVGYWLKQLHVGHRRCPVILVASQADRGSSTLTPEELNAFCRQHGVEGPIETSALTGTGVSELIKRMRSLIPWEDKPATVTTTTFKRIKDYVLGLKAAESETAGETVIVTPEELRTRLESPDSDWRFTDAEVLTALGHLENYGYVRRLRTSKGALRILLEPQRLNNLASSFVLEARRNPKGLGALAEVQLLTGGYDFPELRDLDENQREVLLDSVALLFLEHHVCFRETDPLRVEPYLIFPELINLKKPPEEERATEDGVAYTVTGPTENVFASLVVLLGYTHTFTRTSQWRNNARYEVGEGLVCGFRQEAERDGELDLVLCFSPQVGFPVRTLFQGLFESFLARRNLAVMRYEPVRCSKGHSLNRVVLRDTIRQGEGRAFCSKCGEMLALPRFAEAIQLTHDLEAQVEEQRRTAEQRTRFEQAVFQVRAFVSEQDIDPPACFISYAWGITEQERWVEKRLAADLQKAGVEVTLDRWHNIRIGASVARFVERIERSDRIVVVGTPLYRDKYENKDASTGYVVAAEVDVIANRLLGTEVQKQSVLPLLLDGDKTASLPPLLQGRVYADFRNESEYFATAFELILSLYQIAPSHPAVSDLRESLHAAEMK